MKREVLTKVEKEILAKKPRNSLVRLKLYQKGN